MAFALERADRFIKHLGRDSLIVTNQLNWIVGAPVCQRSTMQRGHTVGMYLWIHATAPRRAQGDEGVTRGGAGSKLTYIHRRLGAGIGGSNTVPSSSSWSLAMDAV